MNETKEEMLAFIKKETGWDDKQCEDFLAAAERDELSRQFAESNEDCPILYAYYTQHRWTRKRKYGIVTEQEFRQIEKTVHRSRRCFSEKMAKNCIEEWKNDRRQYPR